MSSYIAISIIHEDQREWALLVDLLEAHLNESLHDPASPRWTSRDVYTHCPMDEFLGRVSESSTGRKEISPPEGTDDEINARWQQEDSRLTTDQARQWVQKAFGRRIQTIKVGTN